MTIVPGTRRRSAISEVPGLPGDNFIDDAAAGFKEGP